ncbi:hypothetical protein TUM19329_04130 [Legionella antarctica]|uniref:Uncharacterized protein n=1 Tax=Legionella antarctica TaxID=2708020 RepID=A0A6F8T207_9GAMM|nr:hypothetical protein [Legionella antarctica]BCA94052.1 hypothetical protein TUM19329_04130 [Legionella antarctica]
MLSDEAINELLDEPPTYDSVFDTPESIELEVNACLQKEIELLKRDNEQLNISNSVLRQQLKLIKEQLTLTEESKQLLNTNVTLLQKNNILLQNENSSLADWLNKTAAKEEQTLLYTDALESCAITIAETPEINFLHLKMKELELCLQQQTGEISVEIEKQVNEKTLLVQENIFELFNQLLDGDVFSNLTSELEVKFTEIIQKEQETLHAELEERMPLQDELTQEYLEGKTKKLAELKKIQGDEKTRLFYNTSYTVFWAKVTGFLSVFSGLVEKKAGFADKTVELSSSLIGGLLGSVPFAGPLLDTITSFALKEAGGAVIGYFENKKAEHLLEVIQNPDHAKKAAELFARSLTLRYQVDIQTWDVKNIKSTATLYSNQIYDLSIKGKIYECRDNPVDDKITTFLAALKEIASKEISCEISTRKSRLHNAQPSLKTSVHEGTKTIRQTMAKTEHLVVCASIAMNRVTRQNSGLLEESSLNAKQIEELSSKVFLLETEVRKKDEETKLLRQDLSALKDTIAHCLTPPSKATTHVAPLKKPTKKGMASFFSKKTAPDETDIHQVDISAVKLRC